VIIRRVGYTLVVSAMLAMILAGCGGGDGTVTAARIYLYRGQTAGDGTGPIVFRVTADGTLDGNCHVSPVCRKTFHIDGTVSADGAVHFQGSGCGITFEGTGQIEPPKGSGLATGSGTWTGSDGSSGTWSVTQSGHTGTLGA
jgi:hypothetical protein